MVASNSHCSLFLCPKQHDFSIKDFSFFLPALQKIGFISQKINAEEHKNSFFTGNRYLDYVAYMGCAPAIQFKASENNKQFCQINILHFDSAKLIHSQALARAPHCPNCQKPVKNWQQNKTSTTIHCDLCHSTSSIETFNWRKMAGYSRLFIEITDIFPKEAIPQQLLLDKLSNITNTGWQYFYSCK